MKKGLSGSTLKLIAIITMLIDHIAAVYLIRVIYSGAATTNQGVIMNWLWENRRIITVYEQMRNIGRIAFPIYCFLLVEGFLHTRDWKKYALRLGIFALVSEIPFNLAIAGEVFSLAYQNVFFTLLLGLLTMKGYQWAEEKENWSSLARCTAEFAIIMAGMVVAVLLATDYDAKGVMCIMVLYIFRQKRSYQVIAGILSFFWWELPAVIAFLPVALYNGKRGWNMKYVFYLFYPVHLLVLYAICVVTGVA